MKHLLFGSLKRSKEATLLFVFAFIIIFLLLPLTLLSLIDVRTQAETDVTHYARGSYDLLIRPPSNIHPMEKEKGLVPENYVGFGEGGISLAQWEKIKAYPEVEIAAPVASLGYYTGLKNYYVYKQPETSTRYTSQLFTSDGISRYPVSKNYSCTLLEYEGPNNFIQKFEPIYTDEDLHNICTSSSYYELPPTYHLIVGIDPLEEEALTGISFPEIHDDAAASGWGKTYNTSFNFFTEVVPVMEIADEGVSLEVDSTIETLDMTVDDTLALRKKYSVDDAPKQTQLPDGTTLMESNIFLFQSLFSDDKQSKNLMAEIERFPVTDRKKVTANIGSVLSPLNQMQPVIIEKDGTVRVRSDEENDYEVMAVLDMTYSSIYYTAGPLTYNHKNDKLALNIIEMDENNIPTFREVKEHGIDLTTLAVEKQAPPFILDPVGQFSIGNYEENLASSPLGIYQLAPAYFIGDGTRESVQLKSTISPGSFITPPAKGIVNIKDAVLMKGENPIDAIRVKVAGIENYSASAARKIERLAKKFEDMGFHVAIVAGSSPQYVSVDVEGIGIVRESWTTLGAAGTIIDQWNMTSLLLGVTFLIVVVSYIVSRMRFWQVSKQADMELLYELGWDRKYQLRLFQGEIALVLLVSLILSLPALFGFKDWIGLDNDVYLWFGLTFVGTFIVLMILLATKFKTTYKTTRVTQGKTLKMRWALGLAGKSLLYYRKHIFPPFFQILLVSALAPFVYLSMSTTVQQTSVTLLGDYINLQTSHLHLLLIAGAILLTIFTLFESLTSLFIVRRGEFETLVDVGWHRIHIFKLYMKESTLWLFAAVSLGHIISLVLFINFFAFQTTVLITMGISFVALFGLTLIITAMTIRRYIS